MPRYELTIDPNYVSHWTVTDALREIFQNALDESSLSPENSMEVIRDGTNLKICTKNAKLPKSTLLIGNSTKRDDDTTIGKEGEGYKLASLVLVREGHSVTIQNFSVKEVWTPKIINSRRYGSELLVFDTTRWMIKSTPNHDLTFIVGGITDEIYEELQKKILHIRDEKVEKFDIGKGSVLTEADECGRVYVNGLYVVTVEGYKYGYDLKPEDIKLDRDRRGVSDFDLSWQTGNMWAKSGDENLLTELLKGGYKDVEYIQTSSFGFHSEILNKVSATFCARHDNKAYPVTTQDELEHVKSKYSDVVPVIVPDSMALVIKSGSAFRETEENLHTVSSGNRKTPKQWLEQFKSEVKYNLSSDDIISLDRIIELSSNWEEQ